MPLLWVAFTLLGSAGQTARNAMQRGLTPQLGALGATLTRFLFGFPFALLFLAVVLAMDRETLAALARLWKPSLAAGFTGAAASQFWFLAFALATAASVRTLALVEVAFAQGVSRFVFKQKTTPREALGIALLLAGAVTIVWARPA